MRQVIDQFIASSEDSNSILMTADMGRFPLAKAAGKLIDVGLSESLLVNIASGLSLAGKNVFIYGVAGFVLHRALEQLKMNFDQRTSCGGRSMRLHFLNAGAGFLYNQCGLGHYLIDDIPTVTTALPRFKCLLPCDAKTLLDDLQSSEQLTYIRLCPDDATAIDQLTCSSSKVGVKVWTFGWLAGSVIQACQRLGIDWHIARTLDDFPDDSSQIIAIYDSSRIQAVEDNKKVVASLHLPDMVDDFTSSSRDNVLDHYGLSYRKIEQFIQLEVAKHGKV